MHRPFLNFLSNIRQVSLALAVSSTLLLSSLGGGSLDRDAFAASVKQTYNLTSLGKLDGRGAVAYGMNAKGEVVGGTNFSCIIYTPCPGFGSHAFVWAAHKLYDLGPGFANAINNSGEITGEVFDPHNNQVAALWANHTFQSYLPSFGGPESVGYGISEKGMVVGWSDDNQAYAGNQLCPTYVCHAFVYDSRKPGPMIDLGPAGSLDGGAQEINKANLVVGIANGPSSVSWYGGRQQLPVTWQDGQMRMLSAPGEFGQAVAVNSSGEIVGGIATNKVDPSDRACGAPKGWPVFHGAVWNNGKLTNLGPTSGFPDAILFALNDAGLVGGLIGLQCGLSYAAIWRNGSPIDLTKVTPKLPQGMVLEEVVAIGDNGNLVADAGNAAGTMSQGYLLTPCTTKCTTAIQESRVATRNGSVATPHALKSEPLVAMVRAAPTGRAIR